MGANVGERFGSTRGRSTLSGQQLEHGAERNATYEDGAPHAEIIQPDPHPSLPPPDPDPVPPVPPPEPSPPKPY